MIQKWKKLKKNEKGLTLIELLAVLVILGIIAAIAIPLIGNVINNSKDRAILADASNIIAGAKLAYANGEQPPFDKTELKNYVEGVDLDAQNLVVEVKYEDGKWKIKYSGFNSIKNEQLKEEIIEDDGYAWESTINNKLKGE
ncbi:prepilin-type N-terminal cleavage/methylation domain-containing protein [Caldibacillus debilis]|uniref:Prepilin-type cleavage/methylation domain-containing protein n=1 Tax=Caldibacillus debilis TaxID=301148 RepID=A0A150M8N4_9BACI|nr:prepilin-type N-terminal cleavage/methylation domain-containing protein [Caldibacillus debilis]KYD20960.1 hypothetical protein B4135_0207 [Caldibacillus debilis]